MGDDSVMDNRNSTAMGELRMRFLTLPASEFGLAPTAEFPRLYAMVMDWPVSEVTATLVACSDGNASLYTTSTFGIIGGVGHEAVRKQASAWVKLGSKWLEEACSALDFSYPGPDRIRFFFLAFDGVRLLEADFKAVCRGAHETSALFAQGQAVLTELRLISEKGSEKKEPAKPRKAWGGPSGYVNCLLTLMSEGVASSISIKSSEPVPDLVRLAAGNKEQLDWIEKQEFDFPSLDVKQVIAVLKKSARVGGLPFLTRRRTLPALHARDDGRVVAQVFDVTVAPFDKSVRIELAPDSDPRVAALQRKADARK